MDWLVLLLLIVIALMWFLIKSTVSYYQLRRVLTKRETASDEFVYRLQGFINASAFPIDINEAEQKLKEELGDYAFFAYKWTAYQDQCREIELRESIGDEAFARQTIEDYEVWKKRMEKRL